MSFAAAVTRTLIASPNNTDLSLQSAGTYQIVSFGPGPMTWRRTHVESPIVHGETLIAAAKENPIIPLSVLVEASSDSELSSRIATLLRAFEQFTYQLSFTMNGTTWKWNCEPADYKPSDAGELKPQHWREFVQVYTFLVPRNPIPVSGPN